MTSNNLWWALLCASAQAQSPIPSLDHAPLRTTKDRVDAAKLLDIAADPTHPLWMRLAGLGSAEVGETLAKCSNLPADAAMELALADQMFVSGQLARNNAIPLHVLELVRDQSDHASSLAANQTWVRHHPPVIHDGMGEDELRRALLDSVKPESVDSARANAGVTISGFIRNPVTPPRRARSNPCHVRERPKVCAVDFSSGAWCSTSGAQT